jgi:hypothetical protein
MRKIIFIALLFISVNSFGQNNGIKETFQNLTVKLDNNTKKLSLKQFVESLYTNSLNALEGEKSGMNIDDLNVSIKNKEGKFELMKLKDLNDIPFDQIESFEYKKDKYTTALYGTVGEKFGMVTLELK